MSAKSKPSTGRHAAGSNSSEGAAVSTISDPMRTPGRPSVSSADGPLQRHEQPFHRAGTDPSLHIGGGDRLQLPALLRLVVQQTLQLVGGQLPPDQALAQLQDPVLVSPHAPQVASLRPRLAGPDPSISAHRLTGGAPGATVGKSRPSASR